VHRQGAYTTYPIADGGPQVVERVRERLVLNVSKALEHHQLGVTRAQLQAGPELIGRRDSRRVDFHDVEAEDALLQIFQKARVLDARESLHGLRGDKRPLPGNLDEQPFLDEFAKRFPERDAADAQLAAEFVLRRNLRAVWIVASADPVANQLVNLLVERHGQILHDLERPRRGGGRSRRPSRHESSSIPSRVSLVSRWECQEEINESFRCITRCSTR